MQLRALVRVQPLLRGSGFLSCLLLGLLLVYRPAYDVFKSNGDVALYHEYAQNALASPPLLPREYPALSTAVFALPQLLAPQHYELGFALLAVLVVWGTVLVIDHISGQGWWLMLYFVLSGWATLFFRYDSFVVLLTVLAFAAGRRGRWLTAQTLLALGVALKLYPVVLMPLVLIWQWRTARHVSLQTLLVHGVIGFLALCTVIGLAPAQAVGMVHYQASRPLEFESLGSSLAWLSGPTLRDISFGSINTLSPVSALVIGGLSVSTVLLLLTLYASFLAGYLSPVVVWALTLLILIGTSKVFSTQYVLWALPFIALVGQPLPPTSRHGPIQDYRYLWLIICGLTSLIFPVGVKWFRWDVVLALVTIRNVLWVMACIALLNLPRGYEVAQRIWYRLQQEAALWQRQKRWIGGIVLGLLGIPLLSGRVLPQMPMHVARTGMQSHEMLDLSGFYNPEIDRVQTLYRWSDGYGRASLRGLTLAPMPLLILRLGGLPASVSLPHPVQIESPTGLRIVVPEIAQPREYQLLLPAAAVSTGVLNLNLTSPTFRIAPDPRELGVRLDSLTLSGPGDAYVLPTASLLLMQGSIVILSSALARRFGLGWGACIVITVALVVGLGLRTSYVMYTQTGWESRGVVWGLIMLAGSYAPPH